MFYLDLFQALEVKQVRYVLVGGLAMNLHGVERATMDIDLALALDPPNLAAALDILHDLDMRLMQPITREQILTPGQLERWFTEKNLIALSLQKQQGHAPTVDLLTHLPFDFAELYAHCEVKKIGGISVNIAHIDDLIRLKRSAGRKIDLADIEALQLLKMLNQAGKES